MRRRYSLSALVSTVVSGPCGYGAHATGRIRQAGEPCCPLIDLNGSKCLCPGPMLLGSSVPERQGVEFEFWQRRPIGGHVGFFLAQPQGIRLRAEACPAAGVQGQHGDAVAWEVLAGSRSQRGCGQAEGQGWGVLARQLGWAGCGVVETRRPFRQPSLHTQTLANFSWRRWERPRVGSPRTPTPQVPVRACLPGPPRSEPSSLLLCSLDMVECRAAVLKTSRLSRGNNIQEDAGSSVLRRLHAEM